MTLSDPLLKELKGLIAALIQKGPGPFRENDETVYSLCQCLETIFTKGLIRHDGFTPWKTDSFQWFFQIMRKYHKTIPLVFKVVFDEVVNNQKTKTHMGKTRLLLRACLKKRCLFLPVEYHVANRDFDDTTMRVSYNPETSILGHEILSQIFLSLLQQLSYYEFTFELSNASFLDESWQLPSIVKKEMVPCKLLGLTLGFPLGFAVIVEILENSCAADIRDLIEVGDIVDEINGIFVRNLFGSKIDELFKKIRSQPFQLSFIKGRNPNTGQVYLPIIKLYRILGLDPLLTSIESNEELRRSKALQQHRNEEIIPSSPASSNHPISSSSSPANEAKNLSSQHHQSKSSLSHPRPYPQSQLNNSSTSALNLQKYPEDSDQLIV